MTDFILQDVSRDDIIKMLKDEQEVRYSKNIQNIYTQQYYASQQDSNYKPVRIEIEIQKYILKKYGYTDNEESLNEYWKIPSTYWNDEEVKNSIFYMKLNIFQYPKINVGDNLIDANLIDYNTDKEITLSSLQNKNKPLVILAGSMT
jgi:hypothetical protein